MRFEIEKGMFLVLLDFSATLELSPSFSPTLVLPKEASGSDLEAQLRPSL